MEAVEWDLLGEDDGFDEECENAWFFVSGLEFSAYANTDGSWSVYEPEAQNDAIARGITPDRESAKRACVEVVAGEVAACEALRARFANAPPTAETLNQFVRTHIEAVFVGLDSHFVYRFEEKVLWLHADGRAVATVTSERDARILLHVARNNTEGLDHEVPKGCCRIVARFGEHTLMGTFSRDELQSARSEGSRAEARS